MGSDHRPSTRRHTSSRSPSPRRKRSRSPRRRSPSPRPAPRSFKRSPSPPRGRGYSPQPSGRDREEWTRPIRDDHRLPPPPPRFNDSRPPQQFGHQPHHAPYRGGRGYGDDGIKAENFQEYRRLKRIQLWESNVNPLWRNTPSPPPGEVLPDDPLPPPPGPPAAKANGDASHSHASKKHKRRSRSPPAAPAAPAETATAAAQGTADGAAEGAAGMTHEEEAPNQELEELDREEAEMFRAWMADQRIAAEAYERARMEEDQDAEMVGPQLPDSGKGGLGRDGGNFGGHMRPGEGERMAAYVASGKRIPRRGEVGLTAQQIENFESLGYIMTGSRHSRMNAVRIRKENQIYTAEEKAALAMFNFEENKMKEARILEDMKRLVSRTTGQIDGEGAGEGAV